MKKIEDRPRYNIAPTQAVITVRKEHGKKTRYFTSMRWGLIPAWAKEMSIGTRTLNAPVGDRDDDTGISRFDS